MSVLFLKITKVFDNVKWHVIMKISGSWRENFCPFAYFFAHQTFLLPFIYLKNTYQGPIMG